MLSVIDIGSASRFRRLIHLCEWSAPAGGRVGAKAAGEQSGRASAEYTGGSETELINGSDPVLVDRHVGAELWEAYVPGALANGRLKAKPEPQIVGKGLKEIQKALNVLKGGVSATKIVVEL